MRFFFLLNRRLHQNLFANTIWIYSRWNWKKTWIHTFINTFFSCAFFIYKPNVVSNDHYYSRCVSVCLRPIYLTRSIEMNYDSIWFASFFLVDDLFWFVENDVWLKSFFLVLKQCFMLLKLVAVLKIHTSFFTSLNYFIK